MRILGSTSFSTNNEPEILKKSKAIPYTIIDRMMATAPMPTGEPMANKPKRKNQASILINITVLIP